MSKQIRIALVGATGLIGESLIEMAVGRSEFRIIGIARREAVLPPGARMEMLIAEPANWPDAIAAANADVLVCALGTTWRKAGKSEAAFRMVDQNLVLSCAEAARKIGVPRMIAISSVGADMASKNLYLRVKGEVEQALGRVGFTRLDIIRPSLLRGPRREMRPAELLGRTLSPLVDWALQGEYRKFRSIESDEVARAILAMTKEKIAGRFVHEHDAIMRAARKLGD